MSDQQESRTAAGHRPVVLVVDDQIDVAETAAEMLVFLGYEAPTAATATEALARLEAGTRVDILFLDIGMRGGMSGIELALITRERFPETAVLLTTGHGDAQTDAQEKGFQVLAKPYLVGPLRDALAGLLGRRSEG